MGFFGCLGYGDTETKFLSFKICLILRARGDPPPPTLTPGSPAPDVRHARLPLGSVSDRLLRECPGPSGVFFYPLHLHCRVGTLFPPLFGLKWINHEPEKSQAYMANCFWNFIYSRFLKKLFTTKKENIPVIAEFHARLSNAANNLRRILAISVTHSQCFWIKLNLDWET